jgi:hypothetical protein
MMATQPNCNNMKIAEYAKSGGIGIAIGTAVAIGVDAFL